MSSIKNSINSSLFKVTSLNSISVIIKILVGLITSNVIAIFVGPSGMALVGNLRNFVSSIEALGTLGFENGVIKYVSENKQNNSKLKATISTIFFTILSSCFILGLTLFLFSDYFNDSVFGTLRYGYIIKFMAVALPFYIGNIFLTAIINGLGNYRKVILITIVGNILGLITSLVLITQFHVKGALFAIILTPSLLFFVSLYYINNEIKIIKFISFKEIKILELKNLSSFTIMALVSSVFGPLVFLAIRHHIIDDLGMNQAGYWEAINRISSYYFLFITSILGIYFLPKLAISKSYAETNTLIKSYFKGVFPLFVFGLIVLFVFKDIFIQLVFTKEFLPVSKLFFWQIVGDILKAASYILAFQFYAKKMTKAFVIFELSSLAILYFSSFYFISIYQIEGVVIAHAFTYIIYFVALVIFFKKSLW